MEEDLATLIRSGAGVPPRVYWVKRPQGSAVPAVVLTKVTGLPSYTMDGADGHALARVQADVFAETYAEAKSAARAIATAVSGYAGTVGITEFQMISLDGERDLFDASANDAERYFRVSTDLIIHHRSA